jgi:hypothetical protein
MLSPKALLVFILSSILVKGSFNAIICDTFKLTPTGLFFGKQYITPYPTMGFSASAISSSPIKNIKIVTSGDSTLDDYKLVVLSDDAVFHYINIDSKYTVSKYHTVKYGRYQAVVNEVKVRVGAVSGLTISFKCFSVDKDRVAAFAYNMEGYNYLSHETSSVSAVRSFHQLYDPNKPGHDDFLRKLAEVTKHPCTYTEAHFNHCRDNYDFKLCSDAYAKNSWTINMCKGTCIKNVCTYP